MQGSSKHLRKNEMWFRIEDVRKYILDKISSNTVQREGGPWKGVMLKKIWGWWVVDSKVDIELVMKKESTNCPSLGCMCRKSMSAVDTIIGIVGPFLSFGYWTATGVEIKMRKNTHKKQL